jgi:hypothetical protein
VNNVYNVLFLAEKKNDEGQPSGRSLEELRMAVKEHLWNQRQLQLVRQNTDTTKTSSQNGENDALEDTASFLETSGDHDDVGSPEARGGRKKQTEVVPFDVSNPNHAGWIPLCWIAFVRLGMGAEQPVERFALEQSGSGVPQKNLEAPNALERQASNRFKQRELREKQDKEMMVQERMTHMDQVLERALGKLTDMRDSAVAQRLGESSTNIQLQQYTAQVQHRQHRIRELKDLMDLLIDSPAECAQARKQLMAILASAPPQCPGTEGYAEIDIGAADSEGQVAKTGVGAAIEEEHDREEHERLSKRQRKPNTRYEA